MESAFQRIRGQKTSKLNNQIEVAITLQAVEETLTAMDQDKIPSAYFGALMTLLEQDDGSKRAAILYLLDIVFKELPDSVLQAKFKEVGKIFVQVIEDEKENAPIVKAILGCFETGLKSLPSSSWNQPLVKQLLQIVLKMTNLGQPKARKRAFEVVETILKSGAPPIASKITSDFCLDKLFKLKKAPTLESDNQNGGQIATFLSFIKSIVTFWKEEDMIKLWDVSKDFMERRIDFVNESIYSILSIIAPFVEGDRLAKILEDFIQFKPSNNKVEHKVKWIQTVQKAYIELIVKDSNYFFTEVPTLIPILFKEMEGISKDRINEAGQCLYHIITSYRYLDSLADNQLETLVNIFELIQSSLTYRFRNAWPNLLLILEALYLTFGKGVPELVIPSVKVLDSMRSEKGFEHKAVLNKTLGAAIKVLGPKRFLNILPLNLENPGSNTVGRAWLLPLLKDYIENADFCFFSEDFMNLADRIESKANSYAMDGKMMDSKIYRTLFQQIWALFPSFAIYPLNLQRGFNSAFVQRILTQISSTPELHATIFNGLALLVEYNRRLVPENQVLEEEEIEEILAERDLDPELVLTNLELLSGFATEFLATLFSAYSEGDPNLRGLILKVILTFLAITPKDQINQTFKKVMSMIEDLQNGDTFDAQNIQMMLDLAAIMIPHLSNQNSMKLFEAAKCYIGNDNDGGLQKRAYKVWIKMMQEPSESIPYNAIVSRLDEVEALILEAGLNVAPAAIKERLTFIKLYIGVLSDKHLHVISALASEAILGTKEVNEKAREAAYDLLVLMANKMKNGGTIDASKLNEEDDRMIEASLKEYIMMVIAGLTGTTSHMISATISALSRIIFEFHEEIEDSFIDDLIKTMEMFVSNTNREIVKSALGFIKVITVALKPESLQPHLPMILENILKWSMENKNKFKAKVRHIVERLIRRFGLEEIEGIFPEEHKKLIINIKKRRARNKKKTHLKDINVHETGKATLGNAFDDALYGSESEGEDEDKVEDEPTTGTKRKAKAATQNFIMEDNEGDTPLDFLDRKAISRISAHKPKPSRISTENSLASSFKVDSNGKLVIIEETEEQPTLEESKSAKPIENDYYIESLENQDGFERVNNRIKFKKQRHQKEQIEEVDEDEELEIKKSSNKNKIGKEYKAKKAAGDIKKKGQLDPYAYVPLNPKMVAKKGKKSGEKMRILKQ